LKNFKLGTEIISTIDHVFTSPPIRLLDGHMKLCALNKKNPVGILVYDINNPNDLYYRNERGIDMGIVSPNTEDLWFFRDIAPFAAQSPRYPELELYTEHLSSVLLGMSHIPKKQRENLAQTAGARLEEVLGVFRSSADILVSWSWYVKNLSSFYQMLGNKELSDFINENAVSYFESDLISLCLPLCIEKTLGTKFDFRSFSDAGIFPKVLFKSCGKEKIPTEIEEGKDIFTIMGLLRKKEILPATSDILTWMLCCANISHFGNDHGFISKGIDSGLFSSCVKELQLTEHNQDCQTFITYSSQVSHTIEKIKNGYKYKAPKQVKLNRLSNFTSMLIMLGSEKIQQAFQKFSKSGTVTEINMMQKFSA